jgi:hypothetical protein
MSLLVCSVSFACLRWEVDMPEGSADLLLQPYTTDMFQLQLHKLHPKAKTLPQHAMKALGVDEV